MNSIMNPESEIVILARPCSKHKDFQKPPGEETSRSHAHAYWGGTLLMRNAKESKSKSRKATLTSPVTSNAQSAMADISIYVYIIILYLSVWLHLPWSLKTRPQTWLASRASLSYFLGSGNASSISRPAPGVLRVTNFAVGCLFPNI